MALLDILMQIFGQDGQTAPPTALFFSEEGGTLERGQKVRIVASMAALKGWTQPNYSEVPVDRQLTLEQLAEYLDGKKEVDQGLFVQCIRERAS